MPDQASVLRELASGKLKYGRKMRILSVTSGKGGVGKTSFTVNLALALADYAYRILILDGDLGLANVDVACGVTPKYTLEHLLSGQKTIEEIIVPGPKGIGILPGGSGVVELANLERSRLVDVLANLGRLENLADILIIDTGAGLNNTVLNFLQASDDIILLTTPEPTALTDAYAMFKALRTAPGGVTVNVVINRVRLETDAQATYQRLEIAVQKFLKGSLSLLGWIYEDPMVGRSVMEQEPLGLLYPDSPAYQCIQWIAGMVSGLYMKPPRQARGIRGFLGQLLRK